VIPNLWPRKKNTRGPEEDSDEDETAVEEDMGDELAGRANGTPLETTKSANNNDDSLEARMEETGRALRDAETKEERALRLKEQQGQPALRRRPGHKSLASTDNLKMPGHFE
jgi:maintenance of morphology protein 1